MNETLINLYEVIKSRKEEPKEGSYTSYLFEKGIDKILKKVGEETSEVIIGAKNLDKTQLCEEICDLAYHIMVLMVEKGISVEEIDKILKTRSLKIGNLKKATISDHNS